MEDYTYFCVFVEGSGCKLEDGSPGVCRKLTDCPEKIKEVREGNRTWDSLGRCGFDHYDEIVCCHGITNKMTERPAENGKCKTVSTQTLLERSSDIMKNEVSPRILVKLNIRQRAKIIEAFRVNIFSFLRC